MSALHDFYTLKQEVRAYFDATPCGRGWTGTKPGCKRAKKGEGVSATQSAAKPNSKKRETLSGTSDVAKRWVNAENDFIDYAQQEHGLSKPESEKLLDFYKKNKMVKIDPVMGQWNPTHGAYLEKDVVKRALAEANKNETKPPRSPKQKAKSTNTSTKKAQAKTANTKTVKAGNGTLTGDPDNDRFMQQYQAKKANGRSLTASQENALKMYEEMANADPKKWKAGEGVGYKVRVQGKASQTNRGFRVQSVDPKTKTATLVQVADTGLTSTGGNNDRVKPQKVHIADLVKDKKYNS